MLSRTLELYGKDSSLVGLYGPYISVIDFWHSDKAPYQKDLAEKITKLFTQIGQVHGPQRQKDWFEAFFYIANLHWDKVDNYRIDKFLMFLRF